MQYFLILIWLRKLDVMLMQSNRDVSTAPFTCPLARSLAPLSRLLPPHCSLRSRAPVCPICQTLTYFEGKLTHIDIQTHQILANGRNFDRWKKTDHTLAVVVVSIIFSSFLLISLEIDAYWAAKISRNSHFPLRKSQGIRKNGSQEA